jgi:hypothetical protein
MNQPFSRYALLGDCPMVDHHSGLFLDIAFYKKFSKLRALDLESSGAVVVVACG